MKRIVIAGIAATLLACGAVLRAQEIPQMPPPQKEHEWLLKFVGEWDSEAEMFMAPGQTPIKSKGTDSARMIGGFWMVAEGKSEMLGMPFSNILTIGYDTETKKYVGTWVDSMTSMLWKYEGTVDATGKILTLETEGPCFKTPGRLAKFKEVIEFKSKDHRVFTSSMQGEDGKWETMVVVNARRKNKT